MKSLLFIISLFLASIAQEFSSQILSLSYEHMVWKIGNKETYVLIDQIGTIRWISLVNGTVIDENYIIYRTGDPNTALQVWEKTVQQRKIPAISWWENK